MPEPSRDAVEESAPQPLAPPPAAPPFDRLGFGYLIGLQGGALVLPFFVGVSAEAVAWCALLYVLQMFGVTAGYHRYFSHRAFKTGAVMRAVLAFLALSTLQKKVSWWAAKHRDHHRHSDRPDDVHSPLVHSLLRSHLTWSFRSDADHPQSHVNDLNQFAEVRWLDNHWRLPFFSFIAVSWLVLGLQGVAAMLWSTALVFHVTAMVNSYAHLVGSRRYDTNDGSRNNLWLALLTFGEGWHNNHHHYPSSCRQGFYWYELDLTWLALRGFERMGLVSDLRAPPGWVYDRAHPARIVAGR